jgi:hypothetical protein
MKFHTHLLVDEYQPSQQEHLYTMGGLQEGAVRDNKGMPALSMTGVGALVTIVVTALNLFGIELPEGTVTKVTEAVVTLAGIGLLIWGQVRRADVKYGVFKK